MHYFQKLNETQNFSLSHMQLTYAEKLQTNKYCQILSRAINLCVTPLTLLIDAVAHVIIGTVAVCGLSQAGLLINFIAQKNNLSWRSPITFSKGYVHLFKGCTHFASILVLPVLGCLSPTIGIYYATMIQLFFAKPKNTAYSRNEEILKGKIEKRPQITDFQQISDILSQSNLMNKKKCERLKIPSKNQKIILLKKNLLKFNNCFSTIQSVFTNLVLKQSLLDIDAISNIENTLNNLKNCKILKDISVGNIDNTTMFYEIQNFYKNFADQIKFISSYTLKKLKEKEFKFTFKKPFLICVENDFWPKFKIIILNNQNSEITWFPKIRDIQKLIFFKIIEILEEQDIEGTFEQIQTSIIDPFCMLLKKEAITIETNPL